VTSAFPELPDVGQTVELLTRIRDEDDDAWTELYRKYHDELLFVVRMNLGTKWRSALQSEEVVLGQGGGRRPSFVN
jgi:hypothetical protein